MGKGISLQEETLSGILLIKVKIEKVIYKELRLQKSFQPLNNLSVWLKNIIHPVQTSWQPSATI
jgi:hypothetical protein